MAELPKRLRTEVRQFVLLPVRPKIFDGVQFRGIGGQKLQPEAATLLADEVPDQSATMTSQAIPEPPVTPLHAQRAQAVTARGRRLAVRLRIAGGHSGPQGSNPALGGRFLKAMNDEEDVTK